MYSITYTAFIPMPPGIPSYHCVLSEKKKSKREKAMKWVEYISKTKDGKHALCDWIWKSGDKVNSVTVAILSINSFTEIVDLRRVQNDHRNRFTR